jgi:hypothetical protein
MHPDIPEFTFFSARINTEMTRRFS